MNDGGISAPGWFNIGGLFETFEVAVVSEQELRDHGYVVEFLDEIDDYLNATFLRSRGRPGLQHVMIL